jgi:hypothetical protein
LQLQGTTTRGLLTPEKISNWRQVGNEDMSVGCVERDK